jgi:hypothetical protein
MLDRRAAVIRRLHQVSEGLQDLARQQIEYIRVVVDQQDPAALRVRHHAFMIARKPHRRPSASGVRDG